MTKLYKLPNGTFVDPKAIIQIVPIEGGPSTISDLDLKARIRIDTTLGNLTLIKYPSFTEMMEDCDRIAREINEMR